MGFNLGSIFTSFLSSGNPQDAIKEAQLQIEAKVGQFLTTGQQVSYLKTQAEAQKRSSNPIVRDKATALSAQGSAILTEYGNIKTDAQTLLNKIIDLKNQMTNDPGKYVDGESSTVFGWRVMDVLNANKNQVLQAGIDSGAMAARIDKYQSNVNTLSRDVEALVAFSQGKGLAATLSGIGGAYTGIAKTGVAVGVGALAVYLLAPSLVSKIGLGRGKR